MRVLDLFSGIGGFSLGLSWAGPFEAVAFCEIDPYCQKVLAKHWPGVPIYDDIKELTAERILADTESKFGDGIQDHAGNSQRPETVSKPGDSCRAIDVITGGFPCQDISHAGKGAGIEAERSGLWSELARLIGELRPRYAIIENVSALLTGGNGDWFATVLGDLAALGFDAEWHCISAAHLGAPHLRDRIWIIAYLQHPDTDRAGSHRAGMHKHGGAELRYKQERKSGSVCENVADPDDAILQRYGEAGERTGERAIGSRSHQARSEPGWWLAEPNVCRVAHGIPARVDRLKGLGNAIVPQMAEFLGRAIMEREGLQ